MTQPVSPLITLIGLPGDACDGDDCAPLPTPPDPDPAPASRA